MSTRTPDERVRDNARIEQALLGKLLPPHDRAIHTKVVGVTKNNPDGSSRQRALEQMTQFEFVDLVRDPNDEWDANAIEVVATLFQGVRFGAGVVPSGLKRIQVGHIDSELAAELAPLMDSGENWRAIATRVGGNISRGLSLMLFRQVEAKPEPTIDDGPSVKPLKCLKCAHEWIPRRYRKPKVCPKCNNPNWQKGPKIVRRRATTNDVTVTTTTPA